MGLAAHTAHDHMEKVPFNSFKKKQFNHCEELYLQGIISKIQAEIRRDL